MPALTTALPASAFRHWLATVNVSVAAFLAGGFAAPLFAAAGWTAVASALYAVYHLTCHQWAFRSFFLLGPSTAPVSGDQLAGLSIYSQQQLGGVGVDPFSFTGNESLGWKMAFCERDLAIYLGVLAVGLLYARQRQLKPLSFSVYALLILPMAVDGFTQLLGWRESTWQLRVGTGLLFGLASAWLVLPRLDETFGLSPAAREYAPDTTCAPGPVVPALATREPTPSAATQPRLAQARPLKQAEPLQPTQAAELRQALPVQATQAAELHEAEPLQATQAPQLSQAEPLQATEPAELSQALPVQATQAAELHEAEPLQASQARQRTQTERLHGTQPVIPSERTLSPRG